MRVLIILTVLLGALPAYAGGIPEDLAVKCIMGEARGESYEGKVAIAAALRNRGTTKGVYGCKAVFTEPDWVWEDARKAWLESAVNDAVNGADHWGSTIVDKAWIAKMDKSMKKTVVVGNHAFYKG